MKTVPRTAAKPLRRALWLAVPLVSACASGPSPETLVDRLTVLTIDAPPEVRPGESIVARSLIVEPKDARWSAISWMCTRGQDGCAELAWLETQEGAADDTVWPGLVAVEGQGIDWIEQDAVITPFLEEVASDEPLPLIQVVTLACEPGLCDVVEGILDGSSTTEDQAALADPLALLEDLPFAGVALTLRTLSVSTRDDDTRHQNPTVTDCSPIKGDWQTNAGGSINVECTWESPSSRQVDAFGYTTAGGWEGQSAQDVYEPGVFTYRWYAPDKAQADVPLWIAVTDGEGGLALWEGAATAQ